MSFLWGIKLAIIACSFFYISRFSWERPFFCCDSSSETVSIELHLLTVKETCWICFFFSDTSCFYCFIFQEIRLNIDMLLTNTRDLYWLILILGIIVGCMYSHFLLLVVFHVVVKIDYSSHAFCISKSVFSSYIYEPFWQVWRYNRCCNNDG